MSVLIHIRVEDGVANALDEACVVDGRSRSNMAGMLLAEALGVKRLPRITNGKIKTVGAAVHPQPERPNEARVEGAAVGAGAAATSGEKHGDGKVLADAVETAQEQQARKFLEQHTKKGRGD